MLSSEPIDAQCTFSEHDINQLFEKKKQIKFRDDDFQLPPLENFYSERMWQIKEFLVMKKELNETKALLDQMELGSWHKHSRAMNNAGGIIQTLRQNFNPEFCSCAWSKFTESLHSYQVIPAVAVDLYKEGYFSELNSVHLCEVPGAFISATNHYLVQTMPQIKWNWLATSLCPFYEGNDIGQMINEDMLILRSWNNWTFLQDGTGDILRRENIQHFTDIEIKERMRNVNVHFVTADGSIDCQDNPGEQENLVVNLHLAEIVTALRILATGGSFVLKIFTFLECQTICHLYLLACTFREVHLFKPASSKEGNSEVYVICTGYLGCEKFKVESNVLLIHMGRPEQTKQAGAMPNIISGDLEDVNRTGTRALFPLFKVKPEFLKRLEDAAQFFVEIQKSVIKRNVDALPAGPSLYKTLKQKHSAVTQRYLDKFPLVPLHPQQTLFKGMKHQGPLSSFHTDPIIESDRSTLEERKNQPRETLQNQLNWIGKKVRRYSEVYCNCVEWNERIKLYGGSICIGYGRSYKNILSSRFCYSRLLRLRQELRQLLLSHQNALPPSLFLRTHQCAGAENENLIGVFKSEFGFKFRTGTKRLCFHEKVDELLFHEDIDVNSRNLSVLLSLLQTLEVDESVFLCEYPLLTRLQAGLIFLTTQIFSNVWIMIDRTCDPPILGVFLFHFKGWCSANEKLRAELNLLNEFLTQNAPSDRTVVELMSTPHLCTSPSWRLIAIYNTMLLVRFMEKLINGGKIGYRYVQGGEHEPAGLLGEAAGWH